MTINKKIHDRRKELGLTLENVGKIVGVGKSTVRKWETGDIENMKRDKIALLAKALQVSPAFIMGWDEEKPITDTDDELSETKRAIIDKIKIMDDSHVAALGEIVDSILRLREKQIP